jgi:hypothetical protein
MISDKEVGNLWQEYSERGRNEIEDGLRAIDDTLEYIAEDRIDGFFWDPGMEIRNDIRRSLATKLDECAACYRRRTHRSSVRRGDRQSAALLTKRWWWRRREWRRQLIARARFVTQSDSFENFWP